MSVTRADVVVPRQLLPTGRSSCYSFSPAEQRFYGDTRRSQTAETVPDARIRHVATKHGAKH